LTGFVTAAAIYIFFTQIKYILDLHVPHRDYHYQQYIWLINHLDESNPWTVMVGGLSFLVMLTIKILKRKYPSTEERLKHWWFRVWRLLSSFTTLIVVAVSAVVAHQLSHAGHPIPVVGYVEPGLSAHAIPDFSTFAINTSLFQSIPVALLAYMEAHAVGRKFAEVSESKGGGTFLLTGWLMDGVREPPERGEGCTVAIPLLLI